LSCLSKVSPAFLLSFLASACLSVGLLLCLPGSNHPSPSSISCRVEGMVSSNPLTPSGLSTGLPCILEVSSGNNVSAWSSLVSTVYSSSKIFSKTVFSACNTSILCSISCGVTVVGSSCTSLARLSAAASSLKFSFLVAKLSSTLVSNLRAAIVFKRSL